MGVNPDKKQHHHVDSGHSIQGQSVTSGIAGDVYVDGGVGSTVNGTVFAGTNTDAILVGRTGSTQNSILASSILLGPPSGDVVLRVPDVVGAASDFSISAGGAHNVAVPRDC